MEVKKDWRLWNETKPPFEIDIREEEAHRVLQPQADPRAFFLCTHPPIPVSLPETDNTTQTFTPQWDWFALARIAQAATSSDAVKPALTMSWALLCVSSCVMCATACYLYCGTVGGIVKTPPYIILEYRGAA